ncbi:PA2169 family four-helix-bundle protein [Negadavirga shengliensis]|uniref:PA2169 family four-helix-bundle protein n=1 Tax=Negadavirga shengliensis TaxID=1389218 RepID=A0ABV9SWM3_9BACT
MAQNKKLINYLNDMLAHNVDTVRGYQDAARNVVNETLKNFFISQAKKRLSLSEELKAEITAQGGKPVEEASFFNVFQRSWTNFRTSLNHDNEKEVCKFCLSAEEKSIREYDVILRNQNLVSERFYKAVENQKQITLEAKEALQAMKEQF